MSFIEVVGTGFLLLVISAASILLVSALQGAGKPIGEAGLVEIAPWIARAVPRVLVRLALLGRKDLVTDIDLEVQTLVDETFAELGELRTPEHAASLGASGNPCHWSRGPAV